jgi:hypothetical protein
MYFPNRYFVHGCLLESWAIYSGETVPIFQRLLPPPPSTKRKRIGCWKRKLQNTSLCPHKQIELQWEDDRGIRDIKREG